MNIIIKTIFIGCIAVASLLPPSTARASTAISIDDRHGFPTLLIDGVDAVRTEPVFWGAQWKWAPSRFTLAPASATSYTVQGDIPDLGLTLHTDIQRANDNTLVWDITFSAAQARSNIVGVGLSFKLAAGVFNAALGTPQLLAQHQGWRWGNTDTQQWVEARFNPAPPALYFEQNQPTELRALLIKDRLPAGPIHYTMTLRWGNQVEWQPPLNERLGGPPPQQWPVSQLDARAPPISLAFLNDGDRPAGQHGPLRVQDGALVFSDGTPARFWGTNITAYALFQTPRDTVRQQAKRLAAQGYNLVRLHHHDSPWVDPNIFGSAKKTPYTGAPDAAALDKLDWWIKCLKDEGIYVWLDLHVLRALRREDGVDAFDEISRGKDTADLRGYNYVNPTIEAALQRFNEAYLNHPNPYTGWTLKDEPAIAFGLITNENDVTWHFGNNLLPDKGVPRHSQWYMTQARQFANQNHLSQDTIWRAWEPGPNKLFLNDLERRFNVRMIQHLRGLGVHTPLVTTSLWGRNGLSALPALTSGDVIDVHAYDRSGALERSPLYGATSAHLIAVAHVVGMPLTVSEWNVEPFPSYDRHTWPLYLAATADHQGWDALLQYAYSQEAPWFPGTASNYNSYNDPSVLAMMPAAALVFRQRHVQPARTTYVYDVTADNFFGQGTAASSAPALRSAMEVGQLRVAMPVTKELPWLKRSALPPNATVLHDASRPILPPNAQEATSDTGELRRQWGRGIYTINTPLTQAALGWIGATTIQLPAIDIQLQTRHASVAIQSLDQAPIERSRHILVSIATRSLPQTANRPPFIVEPVAGSLRIKAPAGLRMYRNGALNQWVEWPAPYADGHYTVVLDGTRSVLWLMLRPATP